MEKLVYIVLINYDYEGSEILKVFDSEDKAKDYLMSLDDGPNHSYTMQPWEVK